MPRKTPAKGGRPLNKTQKKQVKNMLLQEVESKFTETSFATTIDHSGSILAIDVPAQGDSDQQRNGDAIRPMKLSLRGVITQGDTSNVVRVIVFRWNLFPTALAPLVSSVLLSASLGGANAPLSHYSHDHIQAKQSTILMDRTYYVGDNGNGYIARLRKDINLKKQRMMQFNAGSATDARYRYYILVVSDSAVATHPGFNCIARLHYKDP